MLRVIVIAMIVIPAMEIWGLIAIGQRIGAWNTFLLILLTGAIGAYFARKEARRVWHDARLQLAAGQVPSQSIIDGICTLPAACF